MDFKGRITLWLRHFWVKYRRVVLIGFVAWLIIFIINQIIKRQPTLISLSNTFNPDVAIITDDELPVSYTEQIKKTMDEYIKHCNNKEYQEAYDMLSDDCKAYLYTNSILVFESYVDRLFATPKIYNYQLFSNFDNYYIYDVTVLDDIGATGTSGNYDPYTEKYTFTRKKDGTFKISTNDFIKTTDINLQVENDDMIVKLLNLNQSYNKSEYMLTIINRTDDFIVISDNTIGKEVTLNINGDKRTATNLTGGEIVLKPGETETYSLIFDKFFDDGKEASEINFNSVRLIENYGLDMADTTTGSRKYYSINIPLT